MHFIVVTLFNISYHRINQNLKFNISVEQIIKCIYNFLKKITFGSLITQRLHHKLDWITIFAWLKHCLVCVLQISLCRALSFIESLTLGKVPSAKRQCMPRVLHLAKEVYDECLYSSRVSLGKEDFVECPTNCSRQRAGHLTKSRIPVM